MAGRVKPIDEGRGLFQVTAGTDPEVWNVTRRYRVTQYVGGGSYGHACRGIDRDNADAPVVIKRIDDVFQTSEDAMRILREVAIARRLDHPNIVKVVDILEPEPNTDARSRSTRPFRVLYIVFQDGGIDLKVWLEQHDRPRISADTLRHLMKQMVAALGYLHRCRVVHRDLKPANILIDPVTLTLRIADFGLSRVIEVSEHEEHQGRHHRVWNFESPRASKCGDGMGSASLVDAECSSGTLPLQRSGSSGEYSSDDSDVEGDAPGLLVRLSTPVVVSRWSAPFNPQSQPHHLPGFPFYFSRAVVLQVPCPRDLPLPRQLQPGDRRLEHGLHLR
jgi:serine/threonine protein kinase